MRLLFLAKRHPQQRDLIERPYGRFYHLPRLLAGMGHEIHVVLCSHRGLPPIAVERDGVRWTSLDLRASGPGAFLKRIKQQACALQPDWVIGCSDAWFGWLAHWLARNAGTRFAVDAYDNFEAYMPWNFPLHWKWHGALRAADVVTAAGPQLAGLLDKYRAYKAPTVVIPMAADPEFVPHDRSEARRALELPRDAPLVGYCGSWARNRGTDVLLSAFRLMRSRQPGVRLVLTGHPPAHALAEPGIQSLGYVDDNRLPWVLSALNVACVITADTAFGRYSYPAKLCEAMACQVPIVATATGPVRWLLHGDERHIVPTGDARAIADRALSQLKNGTTVYPEPLSWEKSAAIFESTLTLGKV